MLADVAICNQQVNRVKVHNIFVQVQGAERLHQLYSVRCIKEAAQSRKGAHLT